MYQLLRAILFRFDAEAVHHFSMRALRWACRLPQVEWMLSRMADPGDAHRTSFLGMNFRNPVGLAAGFDKNALYLKELHSLGFGFVEIGTVTPKPQSGNEKPRLFRLPKDKALINRMGFNNDGMDKIAGRLKAWSGNRRNTGKNRMVIGGNIGKNKQTPNEEAWKDYLLCFETLHPYVDYFVVNVSSPNTPGLRALQEKESLLTIFRALQERNRQLATPKPILLKIAPDLSNEQVDEIIAFAGEIKLDGLIVSNTSISRDGLSSNPAEISRIGNGGLSGRPVARMSTSMLRQIAEKSDLRIPLIGSGGIFTAADAKEKLSAGAELIQVWTGFVYEGPFIVKKICRSL